jgi:hypothetical protein
VDLAAFDPLDFDTIEDIIKLPVLTATVRQRSLIESGALEASPRWTAWQMLSSADAVARLTSVTKLARLDRPEWLFREIWDFIADIALNGNAEDLLPTTAWFWRVFYGDSALARSLRRAVDPMSIAQPVVDSRLFAGDWNNSMLALVGGLAPMSISMKDDPERFRWAKCQSLILGRDSNLASRVLYAGQDRLLKAVVRLDARDVIKHINEYMALGYRPSDGAMLDLWVTHGIERRRDQHLGMLRLGQLSSEEFEVARSKVVANHPNGPQYLDGHKFFLVHRKSGATLSLDQRRVRLLETSRSLRLADREQRDLDWDLFQFFAKILAEYDGPAEIAHVDIDLQARRLIQHTYRVLGNPPELGEAR